jgi:hypothetical protein
MKKKQTKVMCMKKVLGIVKKINGVFQPKDVSDSPLLKDIYTSVRHLDYYSAKQDKLILKNDISALSRDFNKAKEDAKNYFELEPVI